jgi:hypothetical protein
LKLKMETPGPSGRASPFLVAFVIASSSHAARQAQPQEKPEEGLQTGPDADVSPLLAAQTETMRGAVAPQCGQAISCTSERLIFSVRELQLGQRNS